MWKKRAKRDRLGQGQVLGDRQDLDQALALAILRDQREPARDAARDVALASASRRR